MSNLVVPTEIAAYTVGVIGTVAGALSIVFGRVRNQNYNDLKDRVAILEADRLQAAKLHSDNIKAIAHLEGQLQTYKDIPLQQISKSLLTLSGNGVLLTKLNSSNDKILATLQSSALIAKLAANDGGVLIHTEDTNPLAVKQGKEKS